MSNQASVPLRVMNFWRDVEAFNIPTAPSARHAAVELGIPGIQGLPHDLCWAQPETREQPVNLVSAHEGTVLYLYTPHFPEDATLAAARLSAGDISLFEGMTAHRYQIPQRRTAIRWTTNKVRLLEHWYQRDVFRS
nr:hypothetical protein [uncultured Pseudomonas sp.]